LAPHIFVWTLPKAFRIKCESDLHIAVSELDDHNPAFCVPSSSFSRLSEVPQLPERVQDIHPSPPNRHSSKSLLEQRIQINQLLGNNKSLILMSQIVRQISRAQSFYGTD
jgi:hypothetical protein